MVLSIILGKLSRQLVRIQNGKNILSMQNETSMDLFCRMGKCEGKFKLVQLLLLFQGMLCKGQNFWNCSTTALLVAI